MQTPLTDAMQIALDQALVAARKGEVPVGAVITSADGRILVRSHNQMQALADPTAHAEMLAIRAALKARGVARLDGCDLYVTLEPCAMCAGAIAHVRLRRVYFAAYDPKGGAIDHGPRLFNQPTLHHRPDCYGGIREAEAAALLRSFFNERRKAS